MYWDRFTLQRPEKYMYMYVLYNNCTCRIDRQTTQHIMVLIHVEFSYFRCEKNNRVNWSSIVYQKLVIYFYKIMSKYFRDTSMPIKHAALAGNARTIAGPNPL